MSLSLLAGIGAIGEVFGGGQMAMGALIAGFQSVSAGLMEIPFPNIDPVAIELGPLSIKWYGLSYLVGLLLGWLYIRKLVSMEYLWPGDRSPFPLEKTDDLLIYMTLGVILGGRLGYVFFYEPRNYLSNPLEVFQIWKGGMAFHGALIGCATAVWLFSRRHGVSFLNSVDLTSAAVPLGLIFGRIANFINGELWGRPTSVPWGMVFPQAAQMPEFAALEPTPRHPSQLYESFSEGLLLFLLLFVLIHRFGAFKRPGLIIGTFLAGYGIARSICELFRQYDPGHVLSAYGLTPGIVYSIPMIVLGAWFIRRARAQNPAKAT